MANVKITDLTELAAVNIADSDVLPIVDINNDSTKKVTIASIKTLAEANDLITFTRLNANLNVLDANADAIEARRVANVTLQDAIETRRAANVTLLTAEDTALQARLTTNVTSLTNEDTALQSRLATNVTAFTNEDTALQARLATNVTAFTNEDTALQARITANAATAASNDFVTFTRLNANLDIVQDNVAAISVTLGIRGDGNTNDDVTVGTEELVFKGDTGITTSVSSNVVTIDLDDTAVTAGLYGGVSGGVTNVAAVTIDATGRVTNAANVSVVTNLDTLQDNINVLDANADAIETRRVANVTEQTAIEARRVANIAGAVSTITTGNLTASRALASDGSGKVAVSAVTATELGHLDGVTSAIQTQFTAAETRRTNNIAGAISTVLTGDLTASRAVVSGSGGKIEVSDVTSTEIGHLDGVTSAIQTQLNDLETRRNANVTVAGANNAAVETRRVANIAGAISTVTTGNLTASRALASSGSGKIAVSDVTSTELGYLDGVTSAIQTQLDAKIATTTSAANDFVTFTRLDANIDVVSANAAAVETRRVANIAGAVSSLTTGNLTASRALVSDGSGKVAVSDVTSTELGHLDGVTGAIQTQITGAETRRTNNIAGAVSSITTSDLTASRAVVSDSSGKVAVSAVTATEIGHLDGVTSAIQTQFTGAETRRTNNIAGAVSTITTGNLTASRALASSGSGKVAVSAVTATELGYLDGVTSAIQTQLDAKAALAGATFTGQVNMSDDLVVTGNLIVNGDTTTVSTTNLDVEDRMIMLADGVSGSPSGDVGLLFNRGNQGNAAFFYDESASTFKLSDTKDPKSNTALSPVSASNLDVGQLTAASVIQNGATLDNLIGSNVDGAISTVNDTNLTASRALVSSGSGKIAVSDVTSTELGYLDGVTSAIQTQIDSKSSTTNAAALATEDAALETRRTNNIAGAVSTITTGNLTASRAVVTNGSGKIAVSAVTSTEIGYLDGVSSAIQTQLNAKQATITGAATTIDDSDLTASRAVVSDSSGKVAVSAVTATEIGYLDGVTSAIQTQFTGAETRRTNNIAGAVSTITTGNLTASRAVVTNGSGKVAVSDVTSTELAYLDVTTLGTVEASKAVTADANGDVLFPDNEKLKFGTGGDMEISHDGSDNTIKTDDDLNIDASGEVVVSGTTQFETKDFVVSGSRTGTGGAVSRVIWRNRSGSTDINANGAETRIEGWRVNGATPSLIFNFGGTERHRFDDDGKIALGAVPGSIGSITETVEITGTLSTTSTAKLNSLALGGTDVTATATEINKLDGVTATTTELNYVDVTTLGTVEASKAVTADANGDVLFPDNENLLFGTGSDLKIFHNGSHSFIREQGTGDLKIQATSLSIEAGSGEEFITATADGAVEIYHNDVKKLETTSDGATITGKLDAGILEGKGGVTYDPPGSSGSDTATDVAVAVHSGDRIVLGENGYIRTIANATWGSALQFGQSGTGAFAGTEIFGGNDGVTLKHSTSTKLETTSTGATVTGELKTTTLELGGTDITATATELNFVDGVTSAIQTQFTGAETRRTNNIAGAVSTITTGNLTASRALVSDSSGKVSVSSITSTELGHLDGIDQNINSNLAALASGIVTGSVTTLANADTDFGTLTTANIAGSDAFGQAVGGVTNVDLLSDPTGELDSVDLVALS